MKKIYFVILIICITALAGCSNLEKEYRIRTNDLTSVTSLNVDEYLYKSLLNFNVYEYEKNSTLGKLAGKTLLDPKNYQKVDLMSTETNLKESITEVFELIIDLDTLKFKLSIDYMDFYGEYIESYVGYVTPKYDPSSNDYIIQIDDFNISLKESLNKHSFDECNVLGLNRYFKNYEDEVGGIGGVGGVGGLVIITILMLAPHVFEMVETVITEVVQFFDSFWNWLVNVISLTTVETTTTIDYRYQTKIDNKVYILERVISNVMIQVSGKYYLAIADSDDKYVYISPVPLLSEYIAAAVISSNTLVPSITNPNNTYLLSTYTVVDTDAYRVAALASETLYGQYAAYYDPMHDGYNHQLTGVFFNHYHPGVAAVPGLRSPHSFFGFPTIRW